MIKRKRLLISEKKPDEQKGQIAKRPASRVLADISITETIQRSAGSDAGDGHKARGLVIQIRIEEGIGFEEAKEKAIEAITAIFQKRDDAPVEVPGSEKKEGFSQFFRRVRIAHGLTQLEMAKRLGFSKESISSIERNKKQPGPRFMKRFVEEFDIPIEQIMSKD
ncbi:MAG: helix-turn-helix transcriptional regulator [Candidatus Micrarchaeota archaeon]